MSDDPPLLSIILFLATAALSTRIISSSSSEKERKKRIDRRRDNSIKNSASSSRDEDEQDEANYAFKRTRNRLSFDNTNRSYDYNKRSKTRRKREFKFHRHFEQQPHDTTVESMRSYSQLDDLIDDNNRSNHGQGQSHLEQRNRGELIPGALLHRIGNTFSSTFEDEDEDEEDGDFDDIPPGDSTDADADANVNADTSRFAEWRSTYNSKIMPNRVIMVRHGQSEGNIDENLYVNQPDNEIRLTKLGWDQAKMAGRTLRNQILHQGNDNDDADGDGDGEDDDDDNDDGDNAGAAQSSGKSVHFIVSPYVRTMETFHGLASAWCDPDLEFAHVEDLEVRKMLWYDRLFEMGVTWHEDPRIREQDFGNYQDPMEIKKAKRERHKFGVFYYRFPNGESASDVYDRVSTFLDSLWRSFDANRSHNYVLVTHGISIRVLLGECPQISLLCTLPVYDTA